MDDERNEPAGERAPLLLVFGGLAGRVASLVRARPALLARLVFGPRPAIQAVGAFLHLAPEAEGPDEVVACIINGRHPRDLLRLALPNAPARLYRVLDRAGDRVRPRAFYERLRVVSRGPFGEALLDGGGPLDEARLGYFEALARMDSALVPLCRALPEEGAYWADALDGLLAVLRAHDAIRADDLRLPAGSGMPAVARRLRAMLARVEAPDPGFAPPPPFRQVRTTGELQRVGRALRNCVALPNWGAAERHLRLIDGTEVYLAAEHPPLLAALRRVAPGVWRLEQVAGPGNAEPLAGAQEALLLGLAAVGLRVVAADPAASLGRLENEARRGRDGRRREDDEADGDGIDAEDAGAGEAEVA